MASLNESTLQKLGLDAEADEAAIEAAIDALAEQSDTDEDPGPAPEPTAEQITAVAAKFGLTVVDSTVHDQMVADARAGAEARAQQLREADERTIRDALSTGRITPASAKTWREKLAKNREDTAALLATLPANASMPVGEVGHAISDEGNTLDAEMADSFAKVTGHTYGKDS